MARWDFKLPDIGEGVAEGEIVAWRVAPGDAVREDAPVVEVMTDKATVTITAPHAGRVVETRGRVGEIVPVHSVLVVFDLDDAPPAHANGSAANVSSPSAKPPPPPPASEARDGSRGAAGASETYFNEKPLATPSTRKFARDMNVDLRRVPPSGPQGRVTREDVEAFCAPRDTSGSPTAPWTGLGGGPAATLVGITPEEGASAASEPDVTDAARPAPTGDVRTPFAGLRRRIATKMSLATSKAAHFTFVEECDVTQLKAVRERLKEPAAAQGVKLTFLPFIVKAVVAALKRHPMLNSMLDEAAQEIVFRKQYNIGIATATDAGLVVPVLKRADQRSLADIAREIERLANGARSGKARLEDLQGSTFTITSLGAQGGLLATPIVNHPEVAILGVHRIKQRPVVKDGQIVVGDVMLLSLSFDHRIVDGHVGAAFAYDVIGYLEQPERLLLEMA